MNKSDITAFRKLFKPDNTNISHISGYYVDAEGTVLHKFSKSFLNLENEDILRWLVYFKKGISEKPVTKTFTEHRDMLALRDSGLAESAVESFFEKMKENDTLVRNRLYILIHNTVDLFNKVQQESELSYDHIVGFVMPVELDSPCFAFTNNEFVAKQRIWEVRQPDFSFVYPSLENGEEDDDKISFFIGKKNEKYYADLIKRVFNIDFTAMSDVKEQFLSAITHTLTQSDIADDQKLQILKEIQDVAKDNKPVESAKVEEIFQKHGIEQEVFTEPMTIPSDIITPVTSTIAANDIKISVSKDTVPKIQIKTIDGQKYLSIPIDTETIEVNGITL